MTLLTKLEAEKLVRQASSVVKISAKDIQSAIADNRDATILLVKR